MTPWTPETDTDGVSISDADRRNGSPMWGDMIAHNPENESDRWLVAQEYFDVNYEALPSGVSQRRNEVDEIITILDSRIDDIDTYHDPNSKSVGVRSRQVYALVDLLVQSGVIKGRPTVAV